MKATKAFYYHLIIGVIYLTLIAFGTWNVSGGDIAYWILSSMLLLTHLLILLFLKKRKNELSAWILLLILAIAISFISRQIYLGRDYKEGIEFNEK